MGVETARWSLRICGALASSLMSAGAVAPGMRLMFAGLAALQFFWIGQDSRRREK